MSQKKCWMKISAWLVIVAFLPQQICWAGISDDLRSRLPSLSSLKTSAKTSAQSAVSTVRNTYNAAAGISGAIQQVTGISPTKLDSISNKIGLTKLAVGLTAGVITQKPQVVSQIANINLRDKAVSVVSSLSNSINNKWVALNDSFFKSSLVDHKKQALSLNPQGAEYKSYMGWMETNDPKVFAEVKTLEKQGLVGRKFSDTYDGPMKGTARAIDSGMVNKFSYRYAGDPEIGKPEVLGVASVIAETPNDVGATISALSGRSAGYQNWANNLEITKIYRNWKNNNVEQPLITKYGNGYYQQMVKPEMEAVGTVATLLIPVGGWGGAASKVSKVSKASNLFSKFSEISRFTKVADFTIDTGKIIRNGRTLTSSVSRGSNLFWNNWSFRAYSKLILGPAGAGVTGGFIYSYLSPYKSSAFNAYSLNQGEITKLMGKISLLQHDSQPGSYNANSYETAISDLSQAFPGETATSEKVSGYLAQNKEKYQGVKFDDPQIAGDLAQIVQLSNKNGELGGKFNTVEKVFTGLAEVNTIAVNGLANRINNLGIPYAGEFVKSVGSFTPLTGPSIGASVGSDPAQGFRGFADFVVNPIEAGIGLRRGSLVDRRWDYHPNYRNIGEAAGSAFILLGGGRQMKDTAGVLKAKANTGYFSGINAAADSFLTANPRINNFVSNPRVKSLASHAVLMGPLAAAAFWQGYNNGDLGTPFASAGVLFAPRIISFGKNQIMPSSKVDIDAASVNLKGTIEKTDNMDIAMGILKNTADREGKNIFIDEANKPRTFYISPVSSPRLDFKSYEGAEFLVTKQLLEAKVGEPIVLIPALTMPAFSYSGNQDKKVLSQYIEKLSNFQKIRNIRNTEKTITTVVLKENNLKPKEYLQYKREYGQWNKEFKKMGGNFNNFIDSLDVSNRKGALEIEAEGFLVVEAINKLEKREELPAHLKPFEAFASMHIENNRIRTSIGQSHLEYDPLSIGLGWQVVEDFLAYKNNNPSKTIYDLGCAGGKTEEMAIVMRFLSEAYPEEKLFYHTAENKLVEEFRAKPILWGAKVNKVESGAISDKLTPFKPGVNIFDTHTLLELTSSGHINGKHLFTDEPQAAMQSADLVKSEPFPLESLSEAERKTNAYIHASLNGLFEITRRVVSRELGRKVSLKDFKDNEITAQLLDKGIIKIGENRKVFFDHRIHNKIINEYQKTKTLDGFSTAEDSGRFYNYGTDLDRVVSVFADMLIKKESKDYYVYKEGEYCISEGFTGAQRPKTHFGGGEESVLNNLQAQVMAIKHSWSLPSFEKILLDKTKHAANYIQSLEQAGSVSAFSGTGKAYEESAAGLNIPVRQIGKNYDSNVREKTEVFPEIKDYGREDVKYYFQKTFTGEIKKIPAGIKTGPIYPKTISIAKTIKESILENTGNSLWLASSNDAKELTKAFKEIRDLQKQSTLEEPNFIRDGSNKFIFKANKRILPGEIKTSLITYNAVGNIKNMSGLSDELKEKFVDMLLADKTLLLKTRAEAIEFAARDSKAMDKLKEFGAELDLTNYQNEYIKFGEKRREDLSQKRILLMQGLIEGSNVAAKITGDNSRGKMFLFGLQPDANVLQAGQRLGIIPSVERRRMPGEYNWFVSLEDAFLTTKERQSLSNAKTKAEIRSILFSASQRLQSEINAQNIAKIGRTKLSSPETQRNMLKVSQKISWERLKTAPSSVFINNSSLFWQMVKDDKDLTTKNIFEKFALKDLGVFNNEGAALIDLTQKLIHLSAGEKIALGNFVFPSISERVKQNGIISVNEAFEAAQLLYHNELVYFSLDTKNNSIIIEGLPKLVTICKLINDMGVPGVSIEDIGQLLNSTKSKFSFYNLISHKLKETNPELERYLDKKIYPVIQLKQEISRIEQEISSRTQPIPHLQQRFLANPLDFIKVRANFLKDKIYTTWYTYRLDKIKEFHRKETVLSKFNGIAGILKQPEGNNILSDLAFLLIPNLNDISNEELGTLKRINEFLSKEEIKDKININTIVLDEIRKLARNEISAAEFVSMHTKESDIKTYAKTIFTYENIARKQFLSYIQGLTGKTVEIKDKSSDLQEEILAKNLGMIPGKDHQFDLVKLRNIAENKLPDDLLLRIYMGFSVSDDEIQEIKDSSSLEQWHKELPDSQGAAASAAKLSRLGKIAGLPKAIADFKQFYSGGNDNYAEAKVNEAVKFLADLDPEIVSKLKQQTVMQGSLAGLMEMAGDLNAGFNFSRFKFMTQLNGGLGEAGNHNAGMLYAPAPGVSNALEYLKYLRGSNWQFPLKSALLGKEHKNTVLQDIEELPSVSLNKPSQVVNPSLSSESVIKQEHPEGMEYQISLSNTDTFKVMGNSGAASGTFKIENNPQANNDESRQSISYNSVTQNWGNDKQTLLTTDPHRFPQAVSSNPSAKFNQEREQAIVTENYPASINTFNIVGDSNSGIASGTFEIANNPQANNIKTQVVVKQQAVLGGNLAKLPVVDSVPGQLTGNLQVADIAPSREQPSGGHFNAPVIKSLLDSNDDLNEMNILRAKPEGLGKWIVSSGVSSIEVEKFFDNNQELAKAMVLGLYNKAGEVNKFKEWLPRMIEATAGKPELGVNNQWNFKIPGITGELEAIELNLAPEMAKVRFMELAQKAGMPEPQMMQTVAAIDRGLMKQPLLMVIAQNLDLSLPELAAEFMLRDIQLGEPGKIESGIFYAPANKIIQASVKQLGKEISNEEISSIHKKSVKLVQDAGQPQIETEKATLPPAKNKFEINEPAIKEAMEKMAEEKGKAPEAVKIAPMEIAQVLSEFIELKKLWGAPAAIKIIEERYSSEIAKQVVAGYTSGIKQNGKPIMPQEGVNLPVVPPAGRIWGIERSMITPVISVFSLKPQAISPKTSKDIVQELSSNEVLPVSPETIEALHSIIPDLEPMTPLMTPLKPPQMVLTSSMANNPSGNGGSFPQEKEVPPAETCL